MSSSGGVDRRPRLGRRAEFAAKRAAYLALIEQGMSMAQACREVGVSRGSGDRWAHQRVRVSDYYARQKARPKAVLPVDAQAGPDGGDSAGRGRFLTEDERVYIADRLIQGGAIREIARELGRAPSTVSREIKRNTHPRARAYSPHQAHRWAAERRRRPKQRRVHSSMELFFRVQQGLCQQWSPEQIVARLRHDFPQHPALNVSVEAVYQALYVQGRGELRRVLAGALRTGRAVRRPRRGSHTEETGTRMATPKLMISERPAEVEDRAVPGHWEGDLIIGKDGKSAIGTLVERSTRYLLLVHLPDGRRPDLVAAAVTATIRRLPAHLRRSLTWDQGFEMHRHHEISIAAELTVYFCDPHSPWQRGTNENTNGLLRQYFPKGTDLSRHTVKDLDKVSYLMNGRPRKTLNWDTPTERLTTLINTTI